jgi:hypothetical protein
MKLDGPDSTIDNQELKQVVDLLSALARNQRVEELTAVIPAGEQLEAHVAAFAKIDFNRLKCLKTYSANLQAFEEALAVMKKTTELSRQPTAEDTKRLNFYLKAVEIQEEVKAITGSDPSELSMKELRDVNAVLEATTTALKEPSNIENTQKLVELSQSVSGKASPKWKRLGAALIMFAGLALIAAGVLSAIPSGGSSLLLVIAGAVALSVTSGATGFGIFQHNRAQGLAQSLRELKDAQKDVKLSIDVEAEDLPLHKDPTSQVPVGGPTQSARSEGSGDEPTREAAGDRGGEVANDNSSRSGGSGATEVPDGVLNSEDDSEDDSEDEGPRPGRR